MDATEAHAAWKGACLEAREIREREIPQWSMDEDRQRWFAELDANKLKSYAADRAQAAAFKAMAHALPEAGPRVFISPRDWLAKESVWRTEFAAVKVMNTAPFYNDWYPCLAMYEVDTSTGERFLRMTEMFDDCVDEAARRNAAYAAYYASKAA